MGGSYTGSRTITEQRWQAIGGHHRTGNARLTRPTGVGFKHQGWISLDHRNAMHLLQPGGLAAEQADQALTVFQHGLRVVADMLAQVATVERRKTHAA
jgi:hypothetical protein